MTDDKLILNAKKRFLELDESELAAVYAECADEDRDHAERGLDDFTEGLTAEDTA